MSQPRFANKWYKHPPVSELRQEFQNVYQQFAPVVLGAADSIDADGNPTPNTTAHAPTTYAEGTLFFATSYPPGVDGGSMQFRQEGGVWVWRWGSYRASSTFSGTGSGTYKRDADGSQHCRFNPLTFTGSGTGTRDETWTYPAVFAEATYAFVQPRSFAHVVSHQGSNGSGATSSANLRIVVDNVAAGDVSTHVYADGQWK